MTSRTERKSIIVGRKTHARLAKLGTIGGTFESVIVQLLNEHEQNGKGVLTRQ